MIRLKFFNKINIISNLFIYKIKIKNNYLNVMVKTVIRYFCYLLTIKSAYQTNVFYIKLLCISQPSHISITFYYDSFILKKNLCK